MNRTSEARLRKLEIEAERRQAKLVNALRATVGLAIRYCIVHYLGDPRPDEAPTITYLRALGYRDFFDFQQAVQLNYKDLQRRHTETVHRLFAKFRVDGDRNNVDVLERLEAGLPVRFRMELRAKTKLNWPPIPEAGHGKA